MVKKAYEVMEEVLKIKPETIHKLTYDSPTETLEPIYFFILDLLQDMGFKVEKLVDNFVSSPGSGHFGEMGQRASIMQQQGSKLLGDINVVLRSIITIIYDLRDYKLRLEQYEHLQDKDAHIQEAARLSLKQIWMDKVDAMKGNSSIKAMALGQAGFVTLIDAFLFVKDEKDVDNLDLNEIVKRILKPRIMEFNMWVKESEIELMKRYKIERAYLKSQVNSLKLYVNWARPYLKAAQDLQMTEHDRHPALVKMFNTMLLELSLLAKSQFKPQLPPPFSSYKPKREYFQVMLIDFEFRGIPQRTQQGYSAGGRAEIYFRGYAVNSDDLKKFYEEFNKSDIVAGLELLEGVTKDSLGELTKDINFFLDEEEKKEDTKENKKEEKKKSFDTSNPILALFGFYNPKKEVKKEEKKDAVIQLNSQDKKMEKDFIVPGLKDKTKEMTFNTFEIYKKAHGMVAFP